MDEPNWSPVFQYEDPGFGSQSIELTAHGGSVTITVEEPWAGSTETGFGYSCSIRLDPDSLHRLIDWLTKAAASTQSGDD